MPARQHKAACRAGTARLMGTYYGNRLFMESITKEYLISMRASLLNIGEEIQKDRNDLYQKLSDICEDIDSMLFDNDDYTWPMAINDFLINFDLSRSTVNSHKTRYLQKGIDYFTEDTGPHRALHFEKCGALKILEHCKSERGTRYKRKHGSSIEPKPEHYYINIIKSAIQKFDISKKSFKVKTKYNDYFIDLYLENINLAIECDEHDHYIQEYSDELERREEDIITELGCRFLRFNPHEADFNVGEVINVIFHYISNKLINGKDPISYYHEKRQRSIRRRISFESKDFV